jgi:pyrroloquinoline quinone biosynthesis protein B
MKRQNTQLTPHGLMISLWGVLFFLGMAWSGCKGETDKQQPPASPYVLVLGIAQDAGFPQAHCQKACCAQAWRSPKARRLVCSLALVDPGRQQYWLLEATPDFREQLRRVQQHLGTTSLPAGILLSHAHIGHYSGLIHLGREVMGAPGVPVHAMPRMRQFLAENGPWSQLVALQNISLQPLAADSTVVLGNSFRITPLRVPHRDEYSETVGFRVEGPNNSLLFIPDIDKWGQWERDIRQEVQQVDYAMLDGTFFENGEIPGRDMSEIPHPFVAESLERLAPLAPEQKKGVFFIHFNHTNPLLQAQSPARKSLQGAGFSIAEEGMLLEM